MSYRLTTINQQPVCKTALLPQRLPQQKHPFDDPILSDALSCLEITELQIIYQVKYLLIVDLYVRASDLISSFLLRSQVEDVFEQPWKYTPVSSIIIFLELVDISHDGESLSCSSLSIGKDATVESLGNILHTYKLVWTASSPIIW